MHDRTTAPRPRFRRSRVALAALAVVASFGAVVGSAPAPASASARVQTVHFSTHVHLYGDVVVSVLVQGPNPGNGVPGWSRCVDLPQSGRDTWTDIGVGLVANARYTVSSYSDFACSRGANYRWTTGAVDTRFTHWDVYTIRSPKWTLR
ncbi:hypothetical protein [Clavibacter michiganensis]|uniref:hypothetical protein n=1 Tax=Clavibacter michiganensis TaxID=28447 RepID=UPI0005B90630|nr:hypothetical protein [Clavibacter michiganensis]